MCKMPEKTALIAMSGGVDSSVAALLMKQEGFECTGCTMKLFGGDGRDGETDSKCCSLDDVEDAREVARRLGMKYYVFNFKDDFEEKVICRFIRSYEEGRTPNPCIDCNRYMKFEKLLERAEILGCRYVVTGHYAVIEQTEDGTWLLKKAQDPSKDQSYVLYSLTQQQLAHFRFPLGRLEKSQVRKIAAENGFVNAEKPDSQDICFVPDGDYAAVIEARTGKKPEPGCFVDKDGNILGTHKGIVHYTIGQRKGLGIAFGEPRYVCGICPERNEVVLGTNEELFGTEAEIGEFNWIAGTPPADHFRCSAKIRYRQAEQPAEAEVMGSGHVRLSFDAPQRAITPGQAAVLYDGDLVLGGGVIL